MNTFVKRCSGSMKYIQNLIIISSHRFFLNKSLCCICLLFLTLSTLNSACLMSSSLYPQNSRLNSSKLSCRHSLLSFCSFLLLCSAIFNSRCLFYCFSSPLSPSFYYCPSPFRIAQSSRSFDGRPKA